MRFEPGIGAVEALQRSPAPSQPAAGERVLILTSGLGFGHMRAAQAVEAALLQQQARVRIVDLWSLINPGAASIIHQTYLRLVQEHPALYERLYQLDERTWRQILQSEDGPPAEVMEVLELISSLASSSVAADGGVQYASDRLLLSMLYTSLPYRRESLGGTGVRARLALIKWSWLRMRKRLGTLVTGFAPDLIVSTQMIPAAMIASLRGHRVLAPHVGVLTDYGLHDFWRQAGIDRYCIADAATIASDDPDHERIVATGVPLMPAFANPVSQREARLQLRLPQEGRIVLILGGGLGLSVESMTRRMLQGSSDLTLVVMPGRNTDARAALAEQGNSRLRICSWTERMDLYLRAADVVVGKPGGISVAEALACGRPLFATRSLGGQEGFNVRFLEQHRVGALVRDQDLCGHIESIFTQPGLLDDMQGRAWRLGRRQGATHVADVALDLIAQRRNTISAGMQ